MKRGESTANAQDNVPFLDISNFRLAGVGPCLSEYVSSLPLPAWCPHSPRHAMGSDVVNGDSHQLHRQ